jgi:signal transduction histidine kinase
VHKASKKVIDGTRFSTTEAGIKTVLKCKATLKSPSMFEAEFVSILVNLYSNAIKSCLAAQKRNMEIEVSALQQRGNLVLAVKDKGVGLPKAHWDDVLEPFCSDPADRIYRKLEARIGSSTVYALGRGTGLGLSIVKGICSAYGGKVEISKPAGWALCVAVSLPYKGAAND